MTVPISKSALDRSAKISQNAAKIQGPLINEEWMSKILEFARGEVSAGTKGNTYTPTLDGTRNLKNLWQDFAISKGLMPASDRIDPFAKPHMVVKQGVSSFNSLCASKEEQTFGKAHDAAIEQVLDERGITAKYGGGEVRLPNKPAASQTSGGAFDQRA